MSFIVVFICFLFVTGLLRSAEVTFKKQPSTRRTQTDEIYLYNKRCGPWDCRTKKKRSGCFLHFILVCSRRQYKKEKQVYTNHIKGSLEESI